MFDFNNILNDIHVEQNSTTNNVLMSNIDIRCLFYGKYKLLLDITKVEYTDYYKINNITDNVKINYNKYIIPYDIFTNILVNDFREIDFLASYINDTFKESIAKYKILIDNTNKIENNSNFISIRGNTIFEIVFCGGYDKGNSMLEDAVFIKLNDNITLKEVNDIYDTNFYKVLKQCTL